MHFPHLNSYSCYHLSAICYFGGFCSFVLIIFLLQSYSLSNLEFESMPCSLYSDQCKLSSAWPHLLFLSQHNFCPLTRSALDDKFCLYNIVLGPLLASTPNRERKEEQRLIVWNQHLISALALANLSQISPSITLGFCLLTCTMDRVTLTPQSCSKTKGFQML